MKTKRLLRCSVLSIMVALCIISAPAFAANLSVDKSGWTAVGKNDVQFDSDLLTTEKAYQQNGITLDENSPFTIYDNANNQYAPADYIDGDSHFIGYVGVKSDDVIPNSNIRLRWANGAFLRDGTKLDVVMKISNVHILAVSTSVNDEKPLALVADWTTDMGLTRLHHSSYRGRVWYDVAIELYTAGTNNKLSKDVVFVFRDLDKNGSAEVTCENSLFSEGVYLTAPVLDNAVYVTDDTTVLACDSEFGEKTRFVGTTMAENEESSGMAFRMNSSNTSYRWTGTNRETEVGFASPSVVETRLIGDFADKGVITDTDRRVLWRNNKSIIVRPDDGYHVEKIFVDGKEVEFETNADGSVEYVLMDVASDHIVEAELALGAYIAPEQPSKLEVKNPSTLDSFTIFVGVAGMASVFSLAAVAMMAKRR